MEPSERLKLFDITRHRWAVLEAAKDGAFPKHAELMTSLQEMETSVYYIANGELTRRENESIASWLSRGGQVRAPRLEAEYFISSHILSQLSNQPKPITCLMELDFLMKSEERDQVIEKLTVTYPELFDLFEEGKHIYAKLHLSEATQTAFCTILQKTSRCYANNVAYYTGSFEGERLAGLSFSCFDDESYGLVVSQNPQPKHLREES